MHATRSTDPAGPSSTTRATRARRRWGTLTAMAVAAPAIAAAVGVGTASTASAAPDARAPRPDLGTSAAMAPVRLPGQKAAHTYTAAQAKANDATGGDPKVLPYWTARRMAAATPLDAPGDATFVDHTAHAVARRLPASATKPAASTVLSRVSARTPAAVTNYSITNGKLFIGGYENGSWCSASAINTASKRVLITAGHCVHSGKGGTWRSNLVFVPKYNASNADHDPVGRFQAYRLRTFNAWMNDSDLNRDVGFVTTYSGGDWGARVVDTVGGHGLAYNGGTAFDTSIFGYPSNRVNGDRMSACWGTTYDNSWFDDKSAIKCNFGPGSSGGPWLWNYNNANGLGNVRSVMSTVNSDGVNKGPYFDTAVRDALNAANGDW